MPVINLPRDTRFAELGEGLGKLIGGAVTAYTAKQNESVVAEVLNDPGISELDKAKQIFKRGGRGALDLYKEHLGIDAIKAKIKGTLAEAEKDTAAANAPAARSDFFSRLLGGAQNATGAAGASPAPAPTTPPAASSAPSVAETAFGPAPTKASAPSAPPAATPAPTATPTLSTTAPAPAARPPMSAGLGLAISSVIDTIASASGVTITADEKQTLVPAVGLALYDKKDYIEPIRKFIEVKQAGLMFPGAQEKQQMDLAAQRGVLPTVAPLAKNTLTQSNLDTAAKQQVAPTVGPRAAAETQSAQNAAAATTPTATTPSAVGDAYSSFTPEQNAAVATAAQTGGAKAAGELISKFVSENTTAARSGDADRVRRVAELENRTRTFTQVMDDIEQNPQLQGGLMEGVVNPVLARYGYDFGQIPPAAYGEMATSSQLALQALQGHRGYGGAYLVKAVAETMPTAAKQKIFKAIESNFQAKQDVVELESLRLAAQDKGQNTAQLDAALDRARALERRTDTLWWTADKRVFYKGREIDPDTWLPTKGGATEFESKDNLRIRPGVDMSGAQINQLAREAGKTPGEVLAELRGQGGALPGAPAAVPPAQRAPTQRPSDLLPWTVR